MKYFLTIIAILSLLASPVYAVQDADNNDAIDIAKGGTNATTAAGARTNILGVADSSSAAVFYTDGTNISWATSLNIDVVLADEAPDTTGQITYDATNDALRVYDGAAVDTFSNDAGTATLTNKTMSGADNTFTNIPLGTAVTGTLNPAQIGDDSIAEVKLDIYNAPSDGYVLEYDSTNGMQWTASGSTTTQYSGTATLGTAAIASEACATVVTVAATGVATTDSIIWSLNADPTSTTGYTPSTDGILTIFVYPTTDNVNFKVCNMTAASITPGAVTLNWRVVK